LDRWLSRISGPEKKEEVACIIETSHGLLISFLLEKGWPVYPINPKVVDRRRGASGAKTDTIDAYLLAKVGRGDFAELHRLRPDSEVMQELKLLTRDQDSLIQMQTRLVNQLTACLKAYYPVALSLFSKLQQRSTLLFLQAYPTPQSATSASWEHIAAVLKQAGHTRAEKVAQTIFEILHHPHLTTNEVTTRAKSRLMLALVAQLLPLVEQISAYDEEITHLSSFCRLPGIANRTGHSQIGRSCAAYERAKGGGWPMLQKWRPARCQCPSCWTNTRVVRICTFMGWP
jgi:transposase